MAVSSTTFSQRMKKINSGKTTAWTVPGQGMASVRDERKFLSKSAVKTRMKSTQKRTGIMKYILALISGAASVVAARWLDFTYLETALAFSAEQGVDAANIVANVPTSLVLAFVISFLTMMFLGLRKNALHVQSLSFMCAFLFEADLVALAPDLYAQFYPNTWVTDMLANATFVI